jgi:hypothetical protein
MRRTKKRRVNDDTQWNCVSPCLEICVGVAMELDQDPRQSDAKQVGLGAAAALRR